MNFGTVTEKVKQFPVAVGAGVLALLLLLLIVVRLGNLGELETKVVDLESQLRRMERNALNATHLEENLATLKNYNERIQAKLANPDTKAANLDYFYGLEDGANILVKGVNQRAAQTEADKKIKIKGKPELSLFIPLEFEVNLEGSFQSIVRFIEKLEHDRYFVRISSLHVLPSKDALGTSLNATIVVAVLAPAPKKGDK